MGNIATGIGFLLVGYITAFALVVLRMKSKSPEKSYKNCIINVALNPVRWLKLGPFKGGEKAVSDVDSAMKYAMKKTGLTDFGGTDFAIQYKSMMNCDTQKKQTYTNLGYISARIEFGMTFVRRLKFIQYLKDVPSIKNIPLRTPVFVMGLPRTGTTFLHRLLSLDPAVRAPLLWELLAPVPEPRAAGASVHEDDRKKRAKYIKKLLDTRMSMGDSALKHIHEVGYDLPEECLCALTDEIPVIFQLLYADYLEFDRIKSMDASKAYKYYRLVLQLLSYQVGEETDPKRWMLKCPIHLFFIKELVSAFPDAKLVWTHRHPVSAVSSLCSLIKAFHSIYYTPDCIDVKSMGRSIMKVSADALEQAPRDIAACKVDCANILYDGLVKDPIGTVRNIYKQFNWEVTDEYEAILKEYLAKNKAEREALKKDNSTVVHHYDPESYGMTKEELTSGKFASYAKAYNVPFDDK